MSTKEIPQLREEYILPTNEVIAKVLGESNAAYEVFTSKLTNDLGLNLEWIYYKDQGSWLCKVLHKKKNLFWISVWDNFFRTTFFFTERHLEGFATLDISENIKDDLCASKPIGKLIPLMLSITQKEQIADLLKIIEFKKSLK